MPRRLPSVALGSACVAVFALPAATALGALGLSPLRFMPPGSPFTGTGPTTQSAATNTRGDVVVGETVVSGNGTLTAASVRTRTGARGPWTSTIRLAKATGDTSEPIVAINARGNAVAVFRRAGRYVASRRRATGWVLSSIGAPAPTTDDVTALAVLPNGRARFVHALPDTGCDPTPTSCPWTVVVYDQIGAGSLWIRSADTVRIADAQRPTLAVSRRGDILVAWTTPGGSARVNASRRLISQTTFEAPLAVSPPGVRGDVRAAIGDGGDAVLAWVVPDAPAGGGGFTGQIEVSLRRESSPIWGNAEIVASSGTGNPDPDVDVDGAGDIALAWTSFSGTGPVALDASFRVASTGAWVAAPRLATAVQSAGESVAISSVHADGNRAFVLFARDLGPGAAVPRLAVRRGSGTWRTTALSGNADPGAAAGAVVSPIAASAPDGDLVLVADGLQVRNFDVPVTPLPTRATGVAVQVTGRSAVATFRLTTQSRVYVLRRSGTNFRTAAEYAPRVLPAGANRVRLGRLPVGRYQLTIGACTASRGCTASKPVTFRIR